MTKTCTVCGQTKSVDSFNRMNSTSELLRPACKECTRAANAEYRAKNRESLLAKKRLYAQQNKDKEKQRRDTWRQKYGAREKEQQRQYRDANRDKLAEYLKEYAKQNPGKLQAITSRRRANKRNQTPAWADHDKIAEIYDFAYEFRQAGFDVHVDHIVPISGRNVSGFHAESNLRVCFAKHNLQKSNNFPVEV